MAIKITDVTLRVGKKITASIFADTKAEVVDNLTIGDDVLDYGSNAVTADGDVGLYDSDGTWHWLGE